MSTLRLLGWAFVALAAFFAVRGHLLDRRMQAFRAPGAAPSSFAFVPIRWQRDLYTPAGAALVMGAWKAFGAMLFAFVCAAVLMVMSS